MTGQADGATTEAPAAPTLDADGTSKGGWYIVWMTALVAIMSQIDRGVLALFVQPMKRDYHLTDTQVSLLLGFAFTASYVIGGPPLSRMADQGVRKTVISACLAVWSVATALCTIAQGFWGYFVARAVVGGTEAGCGPASMSMIADAVPRRRLPLAFAIYNSGFIGGGALSLVAGGLLLGLFAGMPATPVPGVGVIYNWQWVFLILGVPGVLIALFFFLTVPEPPRKGSSKKGGYPLREVARYVIDNRAMHLPLLSGVLLMGFQLYGIQAWTPAFFERTYGWGPQMSGPWLGMFGLVSAVVGLFGGAAIADRLAKHRDDTNMRVYFWSQALAVPFGLVAPLMPDPWLALVCISLGAMCASAAGPVYSAALQMTAPNEMRSQITALYFTLTNAIAGTCGPLLVALLTDYVAQDEANLRYVMTGMRCVLGPLGIFFMWKAIKPYTALYRQRLTAV